MPATILDKFGGVCCIGLVWVLVGPGGEGERESVFMALLRDGGDGERVNVVDAAVVVGAVPGSGPLIGINERSVAVRAAGRGDGGGWYC